MKVLDRLDGQTLPVQTSRDQITFPEKETNSTHLRDNDGDDVGPWMGRQGARELGIRAVSVPVVVHFDRGHDVEHRTTGGQPGEVIMDGRCQPVAAG